MRYEEIADYVASWVGEGDQLLAWVNKKSSQLRQEGVFSIDPTRGRFLELLARMQSTKRVLEIGSGVGYSALWLMKGMGRHGTLDAVEFNPVVIRVLEEVVKKARLERRIRIHQGAALEVLERLGGSYDLVFIDADKDEYPQYLDQALRLTGPGSAILADNMFWGGSVILAQKEKEGVRGIMEYTKRVFNDKRLSSLIVPLGDGLALSIRIQ